MLKEAADRVLGGADYQHQHLHLDETRWPSFSNARHTLPAACVPDQLPDLDKFTVLNSQLRLDDVLKTPCVLSNLFTPNTNTQSIFNLKQTCNGETYRIFCQCQFLALVFTDRRKLDTEQL